MSGVYAFDAADGAGDESPHFSLSRVGRFVRFQGFFFDFTRGKTKI
jgi:hypothetical protein